MPLRKGFQRKILPLEGGAHMSILSKKALEILQANTVKTEFTNSVLIQNGFSAATAKYAINELEENGYISIERTFINGNVTFVLL